MIFVFDHPWLGGLFADEAAARLWSAEAQLDHYRRFESALALALEDVGRVSPGMGQAAAAAIQTAHLDMEDLRRGTANDGLPIPAFVRQLRAAAQDAAKAVHTGATSQDVLDTALVLTLKQSSDILAARLQAIEAALTALAQRFGQAQVMGRTRMQAALPLGAPHRIEVWRHPISSHIETLNALRPRVERLQLGGAVGDRAAFGDDADAVAAAMAEQLNLSNGPVWHADRSAIADYAATLSAISGSLGKMGQDVALMAQQGIDEIRLSGGGGSSAMPHKSNPVLAELLITLARANATHLAGIHQAMIHEQERSGAAWMLEWMILPQMAVTAARSTSAALEVISRVEQFGTEA